MINKRRGLRPLLFNNHNTMTDYNTWIAHIRAERRKCAEKLAQYGDKPVVSAQERKRIEEKTRVTIHTNQ